MLLLESSPVSPLIDSVPSPAAEPVRPLPVAVLGGGLSGLSAAWHLRQRGIPVVVFEAGAAPGGVMNSIREGDWLRETGPNTLFESSPAIRAFIISLGLEHRRLEASSAARRRYVVRSGKPVALPDSPFRFAASPLLSLGAKFSLLGEPFRRRAAAGSEESVAQFVTRRLGAEFLDYIVNPFVAGVYAGDPAELSVRHAFPKLHALEQKHGSLARGSFARRNASGAPRGRMISFPDGLAEIPRALAHDLGADLRLKHTVTRVTRIGASWRVAYFSDGKRRESGFSSVICALPPDILAGLGFENVPAAAALGALRTIPQPAVASVFLGYRREDVAHPLDGFGLLTPAVERRRILGTLFSSTLFPGRAPAGHVALTTFVGGTRQPECARGDDRWVVESVQAELAALLGVRGQPVIARVQRWSRAIPQYVVGFQRFKDTCTAVERAAPGLFLGGTCRDGVSLAHCIAAGQRLATAAERHVAKV
ncbi:MAG: protoporphyrinogen oxidase [Lacunisphaera sp.]|nr:protoporphyrinogen oxidase [Lacunisphaera sp.]